MHFLNHAVGVGVPSDAAEALAGRAGHGSKTRSKRFVAWPWKVAARPARSMSKVSRQSYPVTPDGRYFLVSGRLWRATNQPLPEALRQSLVNELMDARRAVRDAKRGKGEVALRGRASMKPRWLWANEVRSGGTMTNSTSTAA